MSQLITVFNAFMNWKIINFLSFHSDYTMERRKKTRYDVEEAVCFVLDPGSDSELSDLESDEDDDFDDRFLNRDIEEKMESLDSVDEGDSFDNKEEAKSQDESDNDGEHEAINNEQKKTNNKQRRTYRWRNREPPVVNDTFSGQAFSLPPESFHELTPMWYFKQFWDEDMMNNLVEQTNLYSVQKTGTTVETTLEEMEQLIGIQMKMALVKMPKVDNYWAEETRYPPVADVMSLKRYKKLRQFLHANDNSLKDTNENKGNKLYKVQPILDALRNNCQKIEQEEFMSIDEQIVPAKTKFSGIRQYNPKKPNKWGFKNFVRAGQSGLIYDFFFYTGAKSAGKEKCTAKDVVLKLCSNIERGCNFKLFYDNWFATLDLGLELKEQGILTVATIRSNRLSGCNLRSEKELKKQGRGSFSYMTDQNSGITVIKWCDNKCVHLVSTYIGINSVGTVKRWNPATKTYIDVQCPEMVKVYNKSMGGVDLVDMLIALYRCKVKTKRWHLLLIFHCVDIAKVNAWLLYRRFCNQLSIPAKQQMPLLKFVSKLSNALIKAGKLGTNTARAGRPSKRRSVGSDSEAPKKGRAPVVALPTQDSRYDQCHHWPEHKEQKNRCRLCKTGYSRVYCEKCHISLCLTSNRNCFRDFHTK